MALNLAQFSVSRPVTVGIISVALFVLGLFFLTKMPVSLYPEVSFPFIRISIPFPGSSPEQIEAKILKPLESELAGLKKLSRVISIARPGFGQVILGFKMSANEREAAESVREKVAAIRGQFPVGAKEPIVTRVDVGATPVLIYGVESTKSPEQTKDFLDEVLVRPLQRTEGVSEAKLIGLGEERLELQLDALKLSQLRVAPLDIYEQLSAKMSLIPWGEVNKNDRMVTVGRNVLPVDVEFWNKTVVSLKDGRGIRLGEVGEVKKIRDERAPSVLINGKEGLGFTITKRTDANTLDTVKSTKAVLSKIQMPEGITLFPILDQSEYIQENAHEVWIALFIGGAFAILVILVFLTDLKSALISATALPVSIAGSFIFMQMLGFSINMMSLLGLSLAIGLLIDDAVVVRESIYKEMENGLKGAEAAIAGTEKVAAAVLATTLAVVAVFLPVGIMDGLIGQFFKQFGVTICIATLISIWVAFTLDPMLSAKFAGETKPLQGKLWDKWRAFLVRCEHRIAASGAWAFRNPTKVIVFAVCALVGAGVLSLSKGADFLAFEDRGQFFINIKSPVGSTRAQTNELVKATVEKIKNLQGLKNIYATVGSTNNERQSELRLVFVSKAERKKGLVEIQKETRDLLKGSQGEWLVMDPPPIEGIGGEAPVTVFIYGDNLQKLRIAADDLRQKIEAIPGVSNARLETDAFGEGVDIEINSKDLGAAGTGSQAIELTGRLALTGLETGNVGPDNTPFYLRLKAEDRNLESIWNSLLVPTLRGPMLISQFATVTETQRATAIDRERRSRKMVIWATPDRTRTFGKIQDDLLIAVNAVKAPFFAEVGGDKEVFEEMIESFSLAIAGSLFFIFIILAAQFENLLRPFVILLSLPLAIIGGLLALSLFGLHLALGALIGMILLIGLAAKNGILLVDAIGVKEKFMPLESAVRESVLERSRAILMTSIAMIFGMIPTAVMRGGGSEFRSPMAIAIIGGVISSTLLSFLVVPAIFGFIGKWRGAPQKSTTAVVGSVFLCCVSVCYSSKSQAEPKMYTPGLADMKAVRKLISKAEVKSDEYYIKSAQTAAEGAKTAAQITFLGGAFVSAERNWTHPGLSQKFDLPSLPVFGVNGGILGKTPAVKSSQIIVPKAQNKFTFGWEIPILNLQAISGLKLADRLIEQVPLVEKARAENASLKNMQDFMAWELSHQMAKIMDEYVKISEVRLKNVLARRAAGTARKLDEAIAQGTLQASIGQSAEVSSQTESLKQQFEMQTRTQLPNESVGVPVFPYSPDLPFRSSAVAALEGVYAIQASTLDLEDAGFYPTLSLQVGHERRLYGKGSPDPQSQLALKAQWNILDGGMRVRHVAQETSKAYELLAQKTELETKLKSQFKTLRIRRDGFLKAKKAAQVSYSAASTASEAAADGLRAGVATYADTRTADEALLKAKLSLLQLEFGLQGVSLENLALTGQWLPFLQGNGN